MTITLSMIFAFAMTLTFVTVCLGPELGAAAATLLGGGYLLTAYLVPDCDYAYTSAVYAEYRMGSLCASDDRHGATYHCDTEKIDQAAAMVAAMRRAAGHATDACAKSAMKYVANDYTRNIDGARAYVETQQRVKDAMKQARAGQ